MMLTIRVTLHHVAADHINLRTTPTMIELDTLKSRRKFQMARLYPRGIQCDDSRSTAKLEKGALVVEMPITKMPPIGADASPDPAPKPAKAEKRTRETAKAADEAPKAAKAGKQSKSTADEAATTADEAPKAAKRAKTAAGEAAKTAAGEAAQAAAEAPRAGKKAKMTAIADRTGPSEARMLELLDEATDTADQRREEGLRKIHKLQAVEAEAKRKAAEKAEERLEKKRALLESFRRQQATDKAKNKAELKQQAAVVGGKPKAQSARGATQATPPKKRRVSFSAESISVGKSR